MTPRVLDFGDYFCLDTCKTFPILKIKGIIRNIQSSLKSVWEGFLLLIGFPLALVYYNLIITLIIIE